MVTENLRVSATKSALEAVVSTFRTKRLECRVVWAYRLKQAHPGLSQKGVTDFHEFE